MKWYIPKSRVAGVHDPATGERVDAVTLRRRTSALKGAMTRQKNRLVDLESVERKLRRSLARATRDKTVDRIEGALSDLRDLRQSVESALYAQEVRYEARSEAVQAVMAGRPEPKVAKRRTATPTPVKGKRLPKLRKGDGPQWVYRVSFNYDKSFDKGGKQAAQVDVFVQREDGKRAKNPVDARDALFQYLRTGKPLAGWDVVRVAWQHRTYNERGQEKRRKTNAGVSGKSEIDAHLRFFSVAGQVRPGFFRKLTTDGDVSAPRALNLNTDGFVVGEEDVNE